MCACVHTLWVYESNIHKSAKSLSTLLISWQIIIIIIIIMTKKYLNVQSFVMVYFQLLSERVSVIVSVCVCVSQIKSRANN